MVLGGPDRNNNGRPDKVTNFIRNITIHTRLRRGKVTNRVRVVLTLKGRGKTRRPQMLFLRLLLRYRIGTRIVFPVQRILSPVMFTPNGSRRPNNLFSLSLNNELRLNLVVMYGVIPIRVGNSLCKQMLLRVPYRHLTKIIMNTKMILIINNTIIRRTSPTLFRVHTGFIPSPRRVLDATITTRINKLNVVAHIRRNMTLYNITIVSRRHQLNHIKRKRNHLLFGRYLCIQAVGQDKSLTLGYRQARERSHPPTLMALLTNFTRLLLTTSRFFLLLRRLDRVHQNLNGIHVEITILP